jgi:1,4-alpha-glucan branching enzyme
MTILFKPAPFGVTTLPLPYNGGGRARVTVLAPRAVGPTARSDKKAGAFRRAQAMAKAKAKITTTEKKKPQKKRVAFTLAAPGAKVVAVAGSFCGWDPAAHLLKRDGKGAWKGSLLLAPGRYEYRFVVDGQWCDDPSCPDRVANVHGSHNCVLSVG